MSIGPEINDGRPNRRRDMLARFHKAPLATRCFWTDEHAGMLRERGYGGIPLAPFPISNLVKVHLRGILVPTVSLMFVSLNCDHQAAHHMVTNVHGHKAENAKGATPWARSMCRTCRSCVRSCRVVKTRRNTRAHKFLEHPLQEGKK